MISPAGPLRSPGPLLVLVLALIALAGTPSLDNQFVTDDRNLFVYRDNQRWDRLAQIWSQGSRWMLEEPGPRPRGGADTYRPLTLTTFVLDREGWGQDPWGFHLTNLGLHLAACALAFAWLRRLIGLPLAAVGTLLLGIHPATAEAWVWINGRSDVLIAIFVLAAALAIDRGRPLLTGLAGLCLLAACLCKETALLAVPLLALRPRWASDPPDTPPLRLRPRPALLALGAAAVAYLVLRSLALDGARVGSVGGSLGALGGRGPVLVIEGLLDLLAPRHLALRPTREDLDQLPAALPIAGLLVMLAALGLLARAWRRQPALTWGGFGFALLLLPTSLGVSFGGGRYLYLPLLLLLPGLLPLAAAAWARIFVRPGAPWRRRAGAALGLGYAATLLLALLTVQRMFTNELTLFEATVEQHPRRALGWGGLGLAYLDLGAPALAREHFERALQILPDKRPWLLGLAEACRQLNDPAPCARTHQRVRELGLPPPRARGARP